MKAYLVRIFLCLLTCALVGGLAAGRSLQPVTKSTQLRRIADRQRRPVINLSSGPGADRWDRGAGFRRSAGLRGDIRCILRSCTGL